MAEITAAVDEAAATSLIHTAEASLGSLSRSGSSSLGPFFAHYSASANISGGTIDLNPPNIIRIDMAQLNFTVSLDFGIDLNNFLPHFCLPQICVTLPFIGRVCTPKICISWPTIHVPLSRSGTVNFTGDFSLNPHLSGPNWLIDIVVAGVPLLQLDPISSLILAGIGTAVSLAALAVPFIGPFLAALVLAVTATIGIAAVTGLLGAILTPFVTGLTFNIYRQPKTFPILPASSPIDPPVNITLDSVTASVVRSNEDELVIGVDIS